MKKNNGYRKPNAQELEIVRSYERSDRNSYFDAEELEMIIDYYLDQDDLQNAMSALQLGQRLHPNAQELKLREVQVLFSLGAFDKALELLDTSVERSDSEALFWRGNIMVQRGEIEQALSIFDHLLEQERGDEFYDDLCYDIARTFKDEENLRYGLPFLKLGHAFNPQNFDLLNHYALSCTLLAQYDLAIELLQKLLDLNAYHQNTWFQLSEVYFCTDNYADALEAVEYAVLLDKTDGAAWRQKGRVLYALKAFGEAITCFRRALDLTHKIEEQSDLYASIGDCYEQLQEYERALTFYRESIKIDQHLHVEEPDVYVGSVFCLLELERYAECEALALKVIAKYPDQSELYVYYAEACMNLGKYEEAELAYRKSLELNENQPMVQVSLGNLYFENLDFATALACYTKAYELDPDTENITLFLAIAHYKNGSEALALQFFRLAIECCENARSVFLEFCPEAVDFVNDYLNNLNIEEK